MTTEADEYGVRAMLTYSDPITADVITVTFNGTEYECRRDEDGGYGAPFDINTQSFDWSEYPFYVASFENNYINTQTAGTYSIKITTVESNITTTPCFEKASTYASALLINEVFSSSISMNNKAPATREGGSDSLILDKPFDVIRTAFKSGKNCVVSLNSGNSTLITNISGYCVAAHEITEYGDAILKWIATDADAYPQK